MNDLNADDATSVATSPAQLHILEHALGVAYITDAQRRRYRKIENCYRNHYVAGVGHHSWEDLLELEQRGLMTRRDVSMPVGTDTAMFFVTDAGFEVLRMYGKVPAVQRELWKGKS